MALTPEPARGELTVRGWGPGAGWALDGVPALIGAGDDVEAWLAMAIPHEVVAGLRHRLPGLRVPTSAAIVEALVPTILEQKVTGVEARRSYREMVIALGQPAPGPAAERLGLYVPPAPDVLASTPSWAFHPFGIERKRAEVITSVCRRAGRLEEVVGMSTAEARRRLTAIPGIGAWTAAEVALTALGDADAVSLGDYHLPNQVSWALAGRARGDDTSMLELLEPYRGQRGRVLRLLTIAGITAPRFGPRNTVRSFRRY